MLTSLAGCLDLDAAMLRLTVLRGKPVECASAPPPSPKNAHCRAAVTRMPMTAGAMGSSSEQEPGTHRGADHLVRHLGLGNVIKRIAAAVCGHDVIRVDGLQRQHSRSDVVVR